MPDSPDRRYSRDELRAIFQRAAARQEAVQAIGRTEQDGLTLAELKQIGAESGIDPAHVAAAAMELERPPGDDSYSRLAGGPTQLRVERVVPGPASDVVWTTMIDELRRTYHNRPGTVKQVGTAWEWTLGWEGADVRAALRSEGEMAQIVLSQSLKATAAIGPSLAMGFGLSALLFAGISALEGSGLAQWDFAFFGLAALISFFAGRLFHGVYAQKQEKKLERLTDRLELIALKDREAAALEAASETARAGTQPDAPLLDDMEERSEASATERRQRSRS